MARPSQIAAPMTPAEIQAATAKNPILAALAQAGKLNLETGAINAADLPADLKKEVERMMGERAGGTIHLPQLFKQTAETEMYGTFTRAGKGGVVTTPQLEPWQIQAMQSVLAEGLAGISPGASAPAMQAALVEQGMGAFAPQQMPQAAPQQLAQGGAYQLPGFGERRAFTPEFAAALSQFRAPTEGTGAQRFIGIGSQLAGLALGAGGTALGLGPLGMPLGALAGAGLGALGEYLYGRATAPSAGQQESQMQQLVAAIQGQGPGFQFAPIAQQARREFTERTIPSIAERFNVLGGARSGAFQQALGRAGSELETSLAALQSQYRQAESGEQRARLQQAMQALSEDRAQQLAGRMQLLREAGLGLETERVRGAYGTQQQQLGLQALGMQQQAGQFGQQIAQQQRARALQQIQLGLAPTTQIHYQAPTPPGYAQMVGPAIEGIKAGAQIGSLFV